MGRQEESSSGGRWGLGMGMVEADRRGMGRELFSQQRTRRERRREGPPGTRSKARSSSPPMPSPPGAPKSRPRARRSSPRVGGSVQEGGSEPEKEGRSGEMLRLVGSAGGNQWEKSSRAVKGGRVCAGEGDCARWTLGGGRRPLARREERGTAARRARARTEHKRERAWAGERGEGREQTLRETESCQASQLQRDHSHFLGRGGWARETERTANKGR